MLSPAEVRQHRAQVQRKQRVGRQADKKQEAKVDALIRIAFDRFEMFIVESNGFLRECAPNGSKMIRYDAFVAGTTLRVVDIHLPTKQMALHVVERMPEVLESKWVHD